MTSTEVAVTDDNQLPDYLRNYEGPTGAEGIENDDLTIPRIYLAQGLTPAVKDGKVNDGDLFLNLTETALAEAGEPLVIVPLIRTKEYLLWRNREDDDGGVMARATLRDDGKYHWDKPHETFETVYGKPPKKVVYETGDPFESTDEEGLHVWGSSFPEDPDSPPAAAVHYNYIVMLPEHDGMIAGISLSKTQVGRAKDFNAMLKLGNAPIFARKFVVVSEDDKRGNNDFKNYRFRPAGFVDEATMRSNLAIIESFEGINVNFDESSDSDDTESDDL